MYGQPVIQQARVAPRKGCVDGNARAGLVYTTDGESHPARGAWIEMYDHTAGANPARPVAPRKGCVD